MLPKQVFDFLENLNDNNNREWFATHKQEYLQADECARYLFDELHEEIQKQDSIEKMQIFRIYRDIRFSKDKSPYKKFFSAWYSRSKPNYRGSYYIHIEPGKSFIEGGFWGPDPEDLLRIRKEFELDDSEMRIITTAPEFIKYFGKLDGEELKTAPKGFDKEHPAIDLLRKKQLLLTRNFSDTEVMGKGFVKEVLVTFGAMRPFLDYMTDVLTTNLNGENVFELK